MITFEKFSATTRRNDGKSTIISAWESRTRVSNCIGEITPRSPATMTTIFERSLADTSRLDLCHRRRWPDPHFEPSCSPNGWTCRVRVNNREYICDHPYSSADLARDKAAELAYMICRNFSFNDGRYPGQKQGQAGVTQGLPVAIGTGRRSNRHHSSGDYAVTSAYGRYGESSSGGSSPRSSETELDTGSRRSSASSPDVAEVCYCHRGHVIQYQLCAYCLREYGWCY